MGDFDREDRTIEIRDTKFFKSRRLPLSDSVVAALQSYLGARKQAGAPTNPDAALFWHQHVAGRYSPAMAESLLVGVMRGAGLKPAMGRMGPRIWATALEESRQQLLWARRYRIPIDGVF